jgi:hypothetical protein
VNPLPNHTSALYSRLSLAAPAYSLIKDSRNNDLERPIACNPTGLLSIQCLCTCRLRPTISLVPIHMKFMNQVKENYKQVLPVIGYYREHLCGLVKDSRTTVFFNMIRELRTSKLMRAIASHLWNFLDEVHKFHMNGEWFKYYIYHMAQGLKSVVMVECRWPALYSTNVIHIIAYVMALYH